MRLSYKINRRIKLNFEGRDRKQKNKLQDESIADINR